MTASAAALARTRRLERIWVWYAWTLAGLIAVFGDGVPARWWWVAGYVALAIPAWLLSRVRSPWPSWIATCVLVPTMFTLLGSVIESLVPEPFHWRVAALDAWLGGRAVAALLSAPPSWLLDVCVLCYAAFYVLPIVLVIAVRKNTAAIAHIAELMTGGFLLSYLGYVIMPTLPPYRFVDYDTPLRGDAVFEFVHTTLYDLEPIRQDCMPSGHTMMTLLCVFLAWKHARRQLWWLLPVGGFLILGTVLLRYHWFVDVLAAVPFALLACWLFAPAAAGQRPGQA